MKINKIQNALFKVKMQLVYLLFLFFLSIAFFLPAYNDLVMHLSV